MSNEEVKSESSGVVTNDGNYVWSNQQSETSTLIKITELLDDDDEDHEEELSDKLQDQDNKQNQEKKENGEPNKKYIVEEPFDYIFEPNHVHHNNHTTEPKDFDASLDLKDGSGFKFARSIRETDDGVLEYEYRSYRFKGSSSCYDDEEEAHSIQDDSHNRDGSCQNLCEHDLQNESHLSRSTFRSISMIKWPQTGFGIELQKQLLGDDETFFYVNRVFADSPAEFSLQPGDILLELDEITLADGVFGSVEQINTYLDQHESVHMIVAHESKYFKIKSENAELLKESQVNCEDIVIVSLKNIS